MTPLVSLLLRGVPHGFFTRRGGVSIDLYASLNCGPGSADDPAAVAENRARVAAFLGVGVGVNGGGALGDRAPTVGAPTVGAPNEGMPVDQSPSEGAPVGALLFVRQSHTPKVATATGPWRGEAPVADAIVTDRPGLALGVLSADCAPVLFHDAEAGVIGAAHAGWRGALAGVLEATVAAMAALGARPGRIRAAIGPCISQAAYQVGPEFLDAFTAEDPDAARFFAGGGDARPMFDLPGYALGRLRAAGVEDCGWSGHCTYSDDARFFSHRRGMHRGEPDYGRLASAIRLP